MIVVSSALTQISLSKSVREAVNAGTKTAKCGGPNPAPLTRDAVSCVCYVITWEFLYFNFMPDFGEKYTNFLIDKTRASGASVEQIAQQTEQMKNFKALYDNPLINAAFTFLEPLPVGIVMTFISALVLRKRRRDEHDLQGLQNQVKNPV